MNKKGANRLIVLVGYNPVIIDKFKSFSDFIEWATKESIDIDVNEKFITIKNKNNPESNFVSILRFLPLDNIYDIIHYELI